jgi:hypothetical protein
METNFESNEDSRSDKLRKIMIGSGVVDLVFLILAVIAFYMRAFPWIYVSWASSIAFIICTIIFFVYRRRYKESLKPVDITPEKTKIDLSKQQSTLMALALVDIICIVMIVLSSPELDIICEDMACLLPLLIFIVLLIISGLITVIKIVRYIDSRKLERAS